MTASKHISVYIHIPFCSKRCGYCDFTTYAGKDSLIPAYVDALCDEIKIITDLVDEKRIAKTIYFGGGTPSLLTIDQYEKIFSILNNCFNIKKDSEITLEANPGSVSSDYLIGLKNLGFNRLSLGAQSTNDEELKFLGRIHDKEGIFNSVKAARVAEFNNLNLDLIFGLPDHVMSNWKRSLLDVASLEVEHISLYSLTIEKGTSFGTLAEKGLMKLPDPDLAAEMYEWSSNELDKLGFQQYEISNWARGDYTCKHNLQYWHNLPYLGFGVGAHGMAGSKRVSNALRINDYMNRINLAEPWDRGVFPISPATVSIKTINKHTSMQEMLMLGLRLTSEGVSAHSFRDRYGEQLIDIFGNEISNLLELKLIEWVGDSIRLTKHGCLLGNQVFMRFVD